MTQQRKRRLRWPTKHEAQLLANTTGIILILLKWLMGG